MYVPTKTPNSPDVGTLSNQRTTHYTYNDGRTDTIHDDWSDPDPERALNEMWIGYTVFDKVVKRDKAGRQIDQLGYRKQKGKYGSRPPIYPPEIWSGIRGERKLRLIKEYEDSLAKAKETTG